LVAAPEPRRAFSAAFLGARHLEQWPLEAWYAVVRDRKAGARSDDEASKRLERSPAWVWTARAPTRTRLVVVDVGRRPLARAPRVVHPVPQG